MTFWGKQNTEKCMWIKFNICKFRAQSSCCTTVPRGGFPHVCTSLPSYLMRLPAGLALKAPCEMLMDQCIHSDGLRDKGGQKIDQYMLGTLWLPPASKGNQQFFDQWWEELGGWWGGGGRAGKCWLCFTEGLCQAGRRVGKAVKLIWATSSMPWKRASIWMILGWNLGLNFSSGNSRQDWESGFPWVCFNCLQGKQTILFLLLWQARPEVLAPAQTPLGI